MAQEHSGIQILSDFEGLSHYKSKLEETINSLNLEVGQRYLSVGIGSNLLPLMIALRGVAVIGFDLNKEHTNFQFDLGKRYDHQLKQVRGSFDIIELDIDSTPLSVIPRGFDVIECVNFQRRYDDKELADTIISLGLPNAKFFVSYFGGLQNEDNQLVRTIQREAESFGRKVRVVKPNLYAGTVYHNTAILLDSSSN
ncbi:hypothetical protein HYW20_02250 [Candidatus Woesearchaeota archaeon]|nr:hypothetical protein [Candidatus Woesearchaeota archaeon]